MIKLFASACIDAPKEAVWLVLSKLEDIALWSESVLSAQCDSDHRQGVGAERTCSLKGNATIKEQWIAWDEGNSFTYVALGIPMIKSARNTWTVRSEHGKTLLTSEAEVEIKGGILGRLLEPVMQPIMQRMAPGALAAFKYLVENGRPYPGKHAELPRAPVTC